jgi:hypothetical protein
MLASLSILEAFDGRPVLVINRIKLNYRTARLPADASSKTRGLYFTMNYDTRFIMY